jgi:GNAT superfamily N-acetyltransferase
VSGLYRSALSECALLRGGAELVASSLALDGLLGLVVQSRSLVVLGYYDSYPAGLGVAEITGSHGELRCVLHCLFVEDGLRRVGIGERMLIELERFAVAHGCQAIDVPVLPGSLPAKAFFESTGYRARLLSMEHRLPTQ